MSPQGVTTSNEYFKIFGQYKSDTYFSKYGMDIILTILILFILCLIFMYLKVQSNKNYYIHGKYTDEDGKQQSIWNREKCKPHILPFSGNLHRPDPQKSAFQTTMNNFEDCVKSPFDKSSLEMLNPFKLMANTLSVLLTTLTAIISGIRSYIQSILDVIFNRFKENKEDLTNIQIDIVRRFTTGIYNKLNTSFNNLRSSIITFTSDTHEKTLMAGISQIKSTVKQYFEKWIAGAIIKSIGAALVAVGHDLNSTIIGALISWIFLIPGNALLKISIKINEELKKSSTVLIGAGENVPKPLGGSIDYTTDKCFLFFMAMNTQLLT